MIIIPVFKLFKSKKMGSSFSILNFVLQGQNKGSYKRIKRKNMTKKIFKKQLVIKSQLKHVIVGTSR
jgi:hypothetical protein